MYRYASFSYQQETHQLYKIRSTVSVKDRNKARTKQAARRESTAELWDESLGNYAVYFICTHGWQFKPRGQGKRTNHIIRAIQCQAKLSANLVKGKDGLFQVRVSKHYASHNHAVGPAVYYSYSEARQVNSPATKGVVKTLVQGTVLILLTDLSVCLNVLCRRVEKEEDIAVS